MAGIEGFNIAMFAGAGMQILNIIQVIVVLGIFGAIMYYYFQHTKYNIKFRIRRVIKGRKILFDDMAKEYLDREGVVWWKLRKKKTVIPEFRAEAIEIDARGRKCVEAYEISPGNYVPIIDRAQLLDPPNELLSIPDRAKREKAIRDWQRMNCVIESFEPYNSNQRLILINQHKKAMMRKSKTWQENMIQIAGIGALVIIVVALLIFYADMAKPLLSMGDKLNAHAEVQREQLEIIRDMKLEIQAIKSQSAAETAMPAVPPS